MQKAGFNGSKQAPIIAALPLGATNFIGTVMSIAFVENWGRRSTLLKTIPGFGCSLLALAVVFYFYVYQNSEGVVQVFIVIFLVIYLIFFGLGIGPLA
mmetsp:Transcript_24934/g.4125  ORF Transcript_24934/g.4125 Transcript_24934/m.4125 type:complete len:98 (+) Transcript_24934:882-1175(+)